MHVLYMYLHAWTEEHLNKLQEHANNPTLACDSNTQTQGASAAPVARVKLVYMESYAHKISKVPYGGDSANRIRKCCLLCRDRGHEFSAGSGDVTF